jgi:hypothetical protein
VCVCELCVCSSVCSILTCFYWMRSWESSPPATTSLMFSSQPNLQSQVGASPLLNISFISFSVYLSCWLCIYIFFDFYFSRGIYIEFIPSISYSITVIAIAGSRLAGCKGVLQLEIFTVANHDYTRLS